jgi:DNA-binding NtrC family response regulator
MRAGANDFLVKPASPERIAVSIRNQLKIGTLSGEVRQLKKKTDNRLTFEDLIAESPEMKQVFRLGSRAAQSDIPILIEGESGAGKELVARAIQGTSSRCGRPFVTVNCGAIPENLIESILFGELRLDMQVKLLRALQEGEVDPVGSKRPVKVDVRIISATNRDLGQMAQEGSFREDLYYRLNVFPILVPALRDRSADIAPLARHFISRFAAEENKPVAGLTPKAAQMIERFSWPGNVRQLENTIFRAVVLCDGSMLDVCDFPQIAAAMGIEAEARSHADVPLPASAAVAPSIPSGSAYALSVTDAGGQIRKFEDLESEIIRMAISRYDGHMSEVARRLGIGRSTLYRKLKEFGLEQTDSQSADTDIEQAIRKAV